MYKLIIVDDEESTSCGLRDYFDWKAHSIEVVGIANDGLTALPMIEQLSPDIVITDVKMPFLNGTELADKLREKQIQVKIIFISGYDDSEYLRSALKVEAIDYLLKPIQFPELHQVIGKTVEAIRVESEQQRLLEDMNQKLIQSFPLLREQFLSYLVRDGFQDQGALQSKLDFFEIKLHMEGLFGVLVVGIDDTFQTFLSMTERNQQLMAFAILNICQEIIDTYSRGYAFQIAPGRFVCILSMHSQDEEDTLYSLLNEMKVNLERILKWTFTLGVGPVVTTLMDIPISYKQAVTAASQKLYLGNSRIIMMESLEPVKHASVLLDSGKADRFTTELKMASEEEITVLLQQYFKQIREIKSYSLQQCRQFCLHLHLLGSLVCADLGLVTDDDSHQQELREQLFHSETLDDMYTLLQYHFSGLCRIIRDKREVKSNHVVKKIKEIIQTTYHRNLSLNEMAEQVYLTSTYICLIFKHETGETINEYLTKTRLEKAKEHLKDPLQKLNQIGQSVGYPDPSYFTRLFKKHTGMTPTEYRERIL
ncbi:response regulator [Paenibacillus sp. FSL H8-0034]|uniref:response regulator n=1 Tax=Paenibacillus sp. FSL H8-0034 TaxID=2954671 RepID=UPI0030F529F1